MMRIAGVVVLVLAAAGCKPGASTGHADGKGTLGDWSFDSASCTSGQREGYFGAMVNGPEGSGIAIKVVKDPILGWSAAVNKAPTCASGKPASDCKAIIYTKLDCKTIDIDVEDTNVTINNIKKVDGHIKLDCDVAGGQVHADLKLDGCH